MTRRATRELAFRMIYEADFGQIPDWDSQAEEFAKKVDQSYLVTLVEGVMAAKQPLDNIIAQYSRGWTLERLARVDRALLRLGIFELLTEQAPPAVVINEAIELAKEYGGDNAPAYINGLLDQVDKDRDQLVDLIQ